ncbi:putative Ig domain-containing protein [Leucobacter chromiiresistens]|uniref:putative Ig domain-containing protein n=1 Tax=Leucobacter chromiiresistens TaxID=1079994 RepID=UPI0009E6692E
MTAGALPDGLRIDATTATLSGTPGAPGTFVLTVTVGFGQDSRAYELSVVDSGAAPPAPDSEDLESP